MGSILLYGLINPWIKGATGPAWVLTALQRDGTPLNLSIPSGTTVAYAATLREVSGTVTKTLTPASITTTTATSGIFTYLIEAATVDTAGSYELCVKITIVVTSPASTKIHIGKMPVTIEDSF